MERGWRGFKPWLTPVRPLDWGAPRLTDDELQQRLAHEFGRAPYSADVGVTPDNEQEDADVSNRVCPS